MITPTRKALDYVWVFSDGMIRNGYIHRVLIIDEVNDRVQNKTVNESIQYTIQVDNGCGGTTSKVYKEDAMFTTKEEAANSWLNKQGLQCGVQKG